MTAGFFSGMGENIPRAAFWKLDFPQANTLEHFQAKHHGPENAWNRKISEGNPSMQNVLYCLWSDENGFVISAELVMVATIVGLGMTVGLAEISSAVNLELHDCARGFLAYNTSWSDDSAGEGGGMWSSEAAEEESSGDFGGDY